MEDIDLLVDLAFALGAALLGGFLAQFLRQPVILGYLLAGIVVGPFTPGPHSDTERVQTLANLGVTLLMFALGTEFSLEGLQRVRKVAVAGGAVQLVLTMMLGTALGLYLGYAVISSIFLGGVISISSSILMLKLLQARDEVESIVGRAALGTSIFQDMATIALIIILPSLSAGIGFDLFASAGLGILQGGAFLAVTYLLGTRIVPPLLARVSRTGSRELFLLSVVAIAITTAVLGHFAGISFALGAFIAGLVVSASEYSAQVLDEIIPLRDLFAILFFVSIGMLVDPALLGTYAVELTLLVLAIVSGKLLIATVAVKLLGFSLENALRTGLLLAQIGEFSFVLAGVGLSSNTINKDLYGLILAAAMLTLVINSLLVNNTERVIVPLLGLANLMGRVALRILPAPVRAWSAFAGLTTGEAEVVSAQTDAERIANQKRHVIICGYGRLGRELARTLERRGFPFVIIDYNVGRVEEAHDDGYLCIRGDATNTATLERAGISLARILAAVLPDLPSAEQVIRTGKSVNPKIYVIARTGDPRAIPHLKEAGADEVIQPEFEAGLELVRATLRKIGVSSLETQAIVGGRRQDHYSADHARDYADESS